MCLFAISLSSLVKCLLRTLAHLLIGLFSYGWVLIILYIFFINLLYHKCPLQIFFPSLSHVFSISWQMSFAGQNYKILMNSILSILKSLPNPKSPRISPMSSSRKQFLFFLKEQNIFPNMPLIKFASCGKQEMFMLKKTEPPTL